MYCIAQILLFIVFSLLYSPAVSSTQNSKDTLMQFRNHQREFCETIHPIHFGDSITSITIAKKNFTKVFVYLSGDCVSSHIQSFGAWEEGDVESILDLLRNSRVAHGIDDPLFVDIGSNIGWYSFVVASEGFRTISFEAFDSNVQLMRTTLCENPSVMENVILVNRALSNEERSCSIMSLVDNYGDGTVFCESNASEVANNENMKLRGSIHMHKLDKYIHESVYVLKIDIEGFELYALKGGSVMFTKYKVYYILTEVNTNRMPKLGIKCEEYILFLFSMGFKLSLSSYFGPFLEEKEIVQFSETKSVFNLYGKNIFV
jgi:FkbM family methyltransferase